MTYWIARRRRGTQTRLHASKECPNAPRKVRPVEPAIVPLLTNSPMCQVCGQPRRQDAKAVSA